MKESTYKYNMALFAGLFLLLLITAPFFHNHAASLEEPVTCPVNVFHISIISALIFFWTLMGYFFEKAEVLSIFDINYFPTSSIPEIIIGRAPPTA